MKTKYIPVGSPDYASALSYLRQTLRDDSYAPLDTMVLSVAYRAGNRMLIQLLNVGALSRVQIAPCVYAYRKEELLERITPDQVWQLCYDLERQAAQRSIKPWQKDTRELLEMNED